MASRRIAAGLEEMMISILTVPRRLSSFLLGLVLALTSVPLLPREPPLGCPKGSRRRSPMWMA